MQSIMATLRISDLLLRAMENHRKIRSKGYVKGDVANASRHHFFKLTKPCFLFKASMCSVKNAKLIGSLGTGNLLGGHVTV